VSLTCELPGVIGVGDADQGPGTLGKRSAPQLDDTPFGDDGVDGVSAW
jgi:hypothetical protein